MSCDARSSNSMKSIPLEHRARVGGGEERASSNAYQASFDFLGFTLYWRKPPRTGRWMLGCKTSGTRLRRAIVAVHDWCRRHRHRPRAEQHAALTSKVRGHMAYFGVNGNVHALRTLRHQVIRAWYKWLLRRSQRSKLTWERFGKYLERYPLPPPRISVQIWGS